MLARRKPSTPASVGSLKRASFWGFASGSIKSLKGFKRHHRVPDTVTDSTRIFVHQVGADDLHEAATAMHNAIKAHFRYRRRDLEQNEDHGAVTIMTPQFTVNITLDVDNDKATRYEMATEVSDIRDPTVLGTEAFASVFDGLFDRIVFHVSGDIPIDDVIDAIESIQDADLISVTYPPNAEQCTIRAKGLTCELVFDRQEITLQMKGKTETAKLLEESHALPRLLLDRGLWGLLPGSERT